MAYNSEEFVGLTRGIDANTMLAGYRHGIFAMEYEDGLYQWWSPDPRAVLPLDGLRISRSLRKSIARFRVTFDSDFDGVLRGCADPSRPDGWIDRGIARAYTELHARGYAHSVETRTPDGELVGGLFVVCIGGLVCGESMFHRVRDASKVALFGLVQRLRQSPGPVLLETQWQTPHLASLGVIEVPSKQYRTWVRQVIDRPNVL